MAASGQSAQRVACPERFRRDIKSDTSHPGACANPKVMLSMCLPTPVAEA